MKIFYSKVSGQHDMRLAPCMVRALRAEAERLLNSDDIRQVRLAATMYRRHPELGGDE